MIFLVDRHKFSQCLEGIFRVFSRHIHPAEQGALQKNIIDYHYCPVKVALTNDNFLF